MTLSSIVSISWLTLLSTNVLAQRTVVPAHFTGTEQSHTQWISNATGFDAPMNQPLNDTSFDWWYFDVVQEPDGRGQNHPSMAMTFHTTGRDGMDVFQNLFPLGLPSNNLIQINLNWPDGGKDAWVLVGDEAVITVEGDGASGEFRGTGCAFEGEADLSEYTVHVDAPEKGIVGTFRVRAVGHCILLSDGFALQCLRVIDRMYHPITHAAQQRPDKTCRSSRAWAG
jgi:hypothetical protein